MNRKNIISLMIVCLIFLLTLFFVISRKSNLEGNLDLPLAFFYQTVELFQAKESTGANAVRAGISYDGSTVEIYDKNSITWTISEESTDIYGDPVMSRLSNGNWAMTAWSTLEDTRGGGNLLYVESSCPMVIDEDVISIGLSDEKECEKMPLVAEGKTSQVFEADGGNYIFHMIAADIYLMHLSDAENQAMDLKEVCILKEEPENLEDLDYGESTLVITKEESDDLLLSDTAIGRRNDGTWVLFVKGIPEDNVCSGEQACELCARGIYRTTSTDLLNWTPLERVVGEASVPEVTTTTDGVVWLYWQDFDKVCETEDISVAVTAPISAAYEMEGSYELSEPIQISFPGEEFEGDSSLHYATNGNPVALPDEEAVEAYKACME